MNECPYRPELHEVPPRIAALPVHRGYPVPFFVVWLNDDGDPVRRGDPAGTPEFRVMDPRAIIDCVKFDLCWICGRPNGSHRYFVVGPMCAVNRTSAEPPMHLECAEWSVKNCPFLSRPHMTRRENAMPETTDPAGIMLARNPGVILMWETAGFSRKSDGRGGVLFDMGEPRSVAFFSEGREATRAEILKSIQSGLPALEELAEAEGPLAVRELGRCVDRAMELVPA